MLADVALRVKEQHGINLEIDESVRMMLAEKGYTPEYGARELRRVVERELEMNLAEKILAHTYEVGISWKAKVDQDRIAILAV